MPTITYTGSDVYHGVDAGTDPPRNLMLRTGESIEVSAEKAEQVARDFPDTFDVTAAKPAAKRPAKPAAST